jgi:hypothetical protein
MGMNGEISTYTISVLELQEYNFDFGLDTYPIWDENYRPILNKAILDFYMFREIGYANPAQWRQRLGNRMDIIMRNKYNDLYKAKAKEFNPLYTMEMYEEYTHNITNDASNSNNGQVDYNTDGSNTNTNNQTNHIGTTDNTTTTANNLALTSQFPSEEMTENDLTSNLFVDNANKTTGDNTVIGISGVDTTIGGGSTVINTGIDKTINSNTGTNNNTMDESYNKKTYGSASDLSFAHAMQQFRDYIDDYQLDNQVIADLKDLFMSIY